MTRTPPDRSEHPPATKPPASSPPPIIRWEDICHGATEVQVEFRDQTYRLRVTKNGKLILNK